MTTATKQAQRVLNLCWQPVYGEWCALILPRYSTRRYLGRGFGRTKFAAIRAAVANARKS